MTTTGDTATRHPGVREGRDRIERYDPAAIEPRWQARWDELGLYDTDLDDGSRPRFYLLTMYHYPSGDAAHRPLVREDADRRDRAATGGCAATTCSCRSGFDAFGLPAENAAIKNRIHPRDWTMANIENDAPPAADDGRDVRLGRRGRHLRPRVLPLEPVAVPAVPGGRAWPTAPCRRSTGAPTTARWRASRSRAPTASAGAAAPRSRSASWTQWYLRITNYADELLDFGGHRLAGADPDHADELDRPLDGRGDRVRDRAVAASRGRRGAARLHDPPRHAVRRDVHGAGAGASAGRDADRARTGGPRSRPTSPRPTTKTEIDRLSTDREKTGVAIGADAINPVNGERIPIFVADYVLGGYGTGAIMAVPAHDERDFEFARAFGLPIVQRRHAQGRRPGRGAAVGVHRRTRPTR